MKIKMALLCLCICAGSHASDGSQNSQQSEGTNDPIDMWLVLDDLAYYLYEGISIDFENNEIYALNNDINNCTRSNSSPPLNNGTLTLITDSQYIGLDGELAYDISRQAVILTSQTNDLVCGGAFEFDRIYFGDFD